MDQVSVLNPLMPGSNKKVTHTETNWQLSAASLFKYVIFLLPPGIKKLRNTSIDPYETQAIISCHKLKLLYCINTVNYSIK